MTLYYLTPISSIFQYFNDTGVILSGGKVWTYLAGTSTLTTTYTDITGNTPNSNPIILGSNGRFSNVQVWQPGGVNIKVVIQDANGVQLGPVFDQLSGINDPATTLSSLSNANSGFGVDLVANAVKSCDLASTLRTYPVPVLANGQTLIVYLEGIGTTADGFGGAFRWVGTSTSSDDNFYVIKPNSAGGSGRYHRIMIPVATEGFFVATLGGVSGTVTGNILYNLFNYQTNNTSQQSQLITLYVSGDLTGTSNTTTLFINGLPSGLQPRSTTKMFVSPMFNSGSLFSGEAEVYGATSGNGGSISFGLSVVSGSFVGPGYSSFTGSGVKGLGNGMSLVYAL